MPCRDGGLEESLAYASEEIRKLTGIACELCKRLEQTEGSAVFHELSGVTYNWWNNHKKRDAEIKEQEQQKLKRDELRKSAFDKLTPQERKALGL